MNALVHVRLRYQQSIRKVSLKHLPVQSQQKISSRKSYEIYSKLKLKTSGQSQGR